MFFLLVIVAAMLLCFSLGYLIGVWSIFGRVQSFIYEESEPGIVRTLGAAAMRDLRRYLVRRDLFLSAAIRMVSLVETRRWRSKYLEMDTQNPE